MPESTDSSLAAALPERFDSYGKTVEGIVLRGIEHPACELKRTVTLSKEDLTDRLDFVKLVQGLANSHAGTECLIVIGADQKEKKFFEVANAADFDPAKLSPILSKYLSPEPSYEVFNDMRAATGARYVLIVLNKVQPRPIVALVDGKTDTKVHFRPGEIWIKHNTGLKTATKADLDLMYQPLIEQEASKRARVIFEHLKADLGPELLSQAVTATPVPELLLGSRERLARFAEAMLAGGESARFKMLLEMGRRTIVEKWNSHLRGDPENYYASEEEKARINEFFRDEFMPTLISIGDLALEVIRYEGPTKWLGSVVDVLAESFTVSCQIIRLQTRSNFGELSVPFSRPAYEIYLTARVLATYAVLRQRGEYLREVLQQYVKPLAPERHRDSLDPFLFWPFSGRLGLPDMKSGRNEEFWQQRVGETWAGTFGSKDEFLSAAAQLEFILELNSHILVAYTHPVSEKFRTEEPKKETVYMPDFWTSRLDPTIPVATSILDALKKDGFPKEIAIEPAITTAIFKDMPAKARVEFYGEFLFNLRAWQQRAMLEHQRFPFDFAWPPPLSNAVELFKLKQAAEKASSNS
jgi:hypothetical protein